MGIFVYTNHQGRPVGTTDDTDGLEIGVYNVHRIPFLGEGLGR